MRKSISKSEIKELNEKLKDKFNVDLLSKKDDVEIINDEVIFVNKEPYFFYDGSELIPTLKLILKENFLKKIIVDMGAVKFVVNGADIMRPGIVFIEEDIKKDDVIVVLDTENKKPLAIGQALFDSKEMDSQTGGKVVKNLHYIGDDIWKFSL